MAGVEPTKFEALDWKKYLYQNRSLKKILLKESLNTSLIRRIILRDDGRYFFLHHHNFRRLIPAGRIAKIRSEMFAQFGADAPSRSDLEAIVTGRALTLQAIARIHHALIKMRFRQSSFDLLEDAGLGNGIPNGSIIPSLRSFDPNVFSKYAGGHRDDVIHELAGLAHVDPESMPERFNGLQKMCRRHSVTDELIAKPTITLRFARNIRQALINKGDVQVAGLTVDSLFPIEQVRLGTRLGTVPFEWSDERVR